MEDDGYRTVILHYLNLFLFATNFGAFRTPCDIFPAMISMLRQTIFSVLLAFCPVAIAQNTPRYLQCGALFDSNSGTLRQHVLIEIQNNKIASVQPGDH